MSALETTWMPRGRGTMRRLVTRTAAVAALAGLALLPACANAADAGESTSSGPREVRILQEADGRWQLRVDGERFQVRGAGLGDGPVAMLAERGGNAFRTWRLPEGAGAAEALLDEAARHGLMVAMGLQMTAERSGFDYGDEAAVRAQRERIRGEVERLRDHPALLMWVAGNELNLEGEDPRAWDAVEDVARMIHGLDPHHPVMTPLAGFSPALIAAVKARAPSLDLLGIQLYGDIDGFPQRLRDAGWSGPYIVTEWGPTGHWESPKTAWDAPIEDDASRKAGLLLERYRRNIASDLGQGLGSFAFLWGDKQERTPTWYGLLLPSGEATPAVDALQYLWTGSWPTQRAPAIEPLRIDGKAAIDSVTLAAGATARATVVAHDPDGDRLSYRWYVLEESRATTVGGDPEAVPRRLEVGLHAPQPGTAVFNAPAGPGAYRLFVEVLDGHGRAAYANLPFRVAAERAPQARTAFDRSAAAHLWTPVAIAAPRHAKYFRINNCLR